MTTRGKFITLEGGEGTGKSTQIKKLSKWLNRQGIDNICTRELNNTMIGPHIREVLVCGDIEQILPMSEVLLFSAARLEHLRKFVEPALAKGQWVICDRFADTTTVLQGMRLNELEKEQMRQLHEIAIGDMWPDLTLSLDADPARGLMRKGAQADLGMDETRFESIGLEFHQQARKVYKDVAKANSHRSVIIDATGPIPQVTQNIITAVVDKFNLEQKAA